ncbi:glycine zipper 2TM domain-containing protein [Ramlibacter sp. G-1-2-2]|uniref:Glycine zipper 2TM domain-containing protein n=1 Tax=Ramlibacter agri TaxID=2728837 RepID=A0A848H9N9_9BURK|nr:glycine zipper 2TM domain-containing protein [Ramlibacter agri]NML47207.1 glycine zipper 2TM domain-containing protein [Ramlibacter agri]
MKRAALFALLATAFVAAQADTFVDNARVRSVQPQYETVQVPREECRSQWVNEPQAVAAPQQQQNNIGGIVLGGVVGGLLGNQVGKGHGKEAATAVGAVTGAVVGNNIANGPPQPPQYVDSQREVRSCRQVVDMQQRQTGFVVSYEYHGHEYSTVMPRDPGPFVPVQVSITPMAQGAAVPPPPRPAGEYYRR